MLMLILLVVLIVFLLGGLPTWGYHQYGYGPSGLIFVILIIILIYFALRHYR